MGLSQKNAAGALCKSGHVFALSSRAVFRYKEVFTITYLQEYKGEFISHLT